MLENILLEPSFFISGNVMYDCVGKVPGGEGGMRRSWKKGDIIQMVVGFRRKSTFPHLAIRITEDSLLKTHC